MKKIIYISFCLFLAASCNDELEIFPTNALSIETGLLNQSDFENAAKGLYTAFRASGYYGPSSGAASIYFIPDVISDNVIINAAGRRSRESFYDWRYDEDNSSETFWLAAYRVIQRANLILENIDVLEDSPFKNNIRGEALAARGIAHFDLAKLYASAPSQASGTSQGIPYVFSTDSGLQPARDNLGDTYTNILKDLNDALAVIGESPNFGRINKNVVHALLSRVYLFMGDYSNCLINANAVVSEEVSSADFFSVWKDATQTSVIWKLPVNEPDNVTIGVAWLQESPDGIRSEYNVDYGLYQMYEDTDIRKSDYFETSDFAGSTYNHIVKYRGRLTGNANEVDAKIIRNAEVLLNKAESLSEMGMDAEALATLDILRANRYSDFSAGTESGGALKNAIAKERRLELAFEGHRFFDLKRKGLGIQRSNFGDKADGSGERPEFRTLAAGDHRFNMAIGTDETAANPNIEQAPGY